MNESEIEVDDVLQTISDMSFSAIGIGGVATLMSFVVVHIVPAVVAVPPHALAQFDMLRTASHALLIAGLVGFFGTAYLRARSYHPEEDGDSA